MKTKMIEGQRDLERETCDLREKLTASEMQTKQLHLEYEKKELGLLGRISALERERASMAAMMKLYEDEKKQNKEIHEYELQLRVNDMKKTIEAIKQENQVEIDRVKRELSAESDAARLLLESERRIFETQIEALKAQLRPVRNHEASTQTLGKDELSATFQKEKAAAALLIHRLEEENSALRRQCEELLKRGDFLETYVSKLKTELQSSLHIREDANRLARENQQLSQELEAALVEIQSRRAEVESLMAEFARMEEVENAQKAKKLQEGKRIMAKTVGGHIKSKQEGQKKFELSLRPNLRTKATEKQARAVPRSNEAQSLGRVGSGSSKMKRARTPPRFANINLESGANSSAARSASSACKEVETRPKNLLSHLAILTSEVVTHEDIQRKTSLVMKGKRSGEGSADVSGAEGCLGKTPEHTILPTTYSDYLRFKQQVGRTSDEVKRMRRENSASLGSRAEAQHTVIPRQKSSIHNIGEITRDLSNVVSQDHSSGNKKGDGELLELLVENKKLEQRLKDIEFRLLESEMKNEELAKDRDKIQNAFEYVVAGTSTGQMKTTRGMMLDGPEGIASKEESSCLNEMKGLVDRIEFENDVPAIFTTANGLNFSICLESFCQEKRSEVSHIIPNCGTMIHPNDPDLVTGRGTALSGTSCDFWRDAHSGVLAPTRLPQS
eukprot:TRINITY_DN2440_c0_g2_i1.p1 TRINITY_DN2440_c0_g2~~TRINITY_DN2440_c0_g2_i1.p1  ORF type:complete len:673 (+),score=143.34 TRINITY_DN2440_c0_g2_i1:385-2403(+)